MYAIKIPNGLAPGFDKLESISKEDGDALVEKGEAELDHSGLLYIAKPKGKYETRVMKAAELDDAPEAEEAPQADAAPEVEDQKPSKKTRARKAKPAADEDEGGDDAA